MFFYQVTFVLTLVHPHPVMGYEFLFLWLLSLRSENPAGRGLSKRLFLQYKFQFFQQAHLTCAYPAFKLFLLPQAAVPGTPGLLYYFPWRTWSRVLDKSSGWHYLPGHKSHFGSIIQNSARCRVVLLFCTEGRTKSINITESHSRQFTSSCPLTVGWCCGKSLLYDWCHLHF